MTFSGMGPPKPHHLFTIVRCGSLAFIEEDGNGQSSTW
jgi:hypothetical protein